MPNTETRECPLCGGTMQLKQVTRTEHMAGFSSAPPRAIREWVCSSCDYFEEADEENG